jgi:hypothetical protein
VAIFDHVGYFYTVCSKLANHSRATVGVAIFDHVGYFYTVCSKLANHSRALDPFRLS